MCHFTKKLRIPIYIQCNKIVFKTQQQCDDDHDHHADDVTKKKKSRTAEMVILTFLS